MRGRGRGRRRSSFKRGRRNARTAMGRPLRVGVRM